MNSTTEEKCEGCKHRAITDEGFCYMFREAPEILPCAQHDMYAGRRREFVENCKKNPNHLRDLVHEMMLKRKLEEIDDLMRGRMFL